ncbi:MAG TPA: hypothetical protein IAB39_00545 [Candidatus Onthovicinus excrementipullorum]|nr:hypothetical protein [Candidatus Onthovicinus excrementipullorum]
MIKKKKNLEKVPRFASWALMNKPFKNEKHYLHESKICFDVKAGEEYTNHVEMSGFYCSSIISYGSDANGFVRFMRHVVFPTLRVNPNLTDSHLACNFNGAVIEINGMQSNEKAVRFVFDGILNVYSIIGDFQIHRKIFTAPDSPSLVEIIEVENGSKQTANINITGLESEKLISSEYCVGFNGYKLFTQIDKHEVRIAPGETDQFYVAYGACSGSENLIVNCIEEHKKRTDFLMRLKSIFVVDTPDEKINIMAYYAKIRAAESIYKTKAGLMHSPGGGAYYAALWTNDQCEYINPLFANLGYETAVKQSLNCYKMYQKYINPKKALITSIISQGDGIWHGAKDRGDSAMYAYGCSRFLLALGDKKIAEKYIQGIRDCLTYTISKKNRFGVIKSDSDELENRFKSGKANLCTSCLAYDAFLSTAYLEKDLGNQQRADRYFKEAGNLKNAIEAYFGKNIENYETYMYCKGEKHLRSWISIPLAVGIFTRKDETAKALLSPGLHVQEGFVTRSGEKTFWDRSTLYAIRGLFYAGFADEANELLKTYSRARLLGEHIPYAVEAFPEGNQSHLSAESGLYLRIFTEGIVGYRPTGFKSFELKPDLPSDWNHMEINNIKLCGETADIKIIRKEENYEMIVKTADKEIKCAGKNAEIRF